LGRRFSGANPKPDRTLNSLRDGQPIVAQTELRRGVLGVVDDILPLDVETDADIAWRQDLLRKIGCKP
jgi:adenosine/AMP kinase